MATNRIELSDGTTLDVQVGAFNQQAAHELAAVTKGLWAHLRDVLLDYGRQDGTPGNMGMDRIERIQETMADAAKILRAAGI